MSNYVVARNYAEALADVAGRDSVGGGGAAALERYGVLLDAVAGAVQTDPTLHAVMMSPRVTKSAKKGVFARALKDTAPDNLVRFLGSVVQRGRQGMLADISKAYNDIVDVKLNRVHAGVVTAHAVDDEAGRSIARRLSEAVGKDVLPHFRTDPSLLGGIVVRIGDRVLDGSLKRRLGLLRYRLLHAPGATE